MARSNVVINLVGQRRETINYSYDDVHNKAARMIAEVRCVICPRLVCARALVCAAPAILTSTADDGAGCGVIFVPTKDAAHNCPLSIVCVPVGFSSWCMPIVVGVVAVLPASLQCAREAGVERLIHFSSLGADPNSASDFFRSKVRVGCVCTKCLPTVLGIRALIYVSRVTLRA